MMVQPLFGASGGALNSFSQNVSSKPPRGAGPQQQGDVLPGTIVDNGRGTQYRVMQELGAGCFGTVSKVQRLSDGKILAMKLQSQRDAAQVAEVQKEVNLLRRLRHPYVVSFFEDFQFRRHICIVMEFCDGGTLHRHVVSRKQQGLSTLRIAGYMAQLASALEFIHSKNVTHRDLKSENVMMTSKMDVKISDFGCGKTLPPGSNQAMTMTGGDRMIIPPEMSHRIQGIPSQGVVSPAYDMWGLGVILSEMVTLKLMVKDICKTAPLCLNRAAEAQILAEAKVVHSGRFHPLLQSLLQHDPNKRAKATEVKAHVKALLRPEVKADPQQLTKTAAKLGVPESQLAEAWEAFQQADTSSRGSITVGQLKQLLSVLHIDMSARALMKQFNKDVTGTLDFTEFATWWLKKDQDWTPTVVPGRHDKEHERVVNKVFGVPPAEYAKLQTAFNHVDFDNSGEITALGLYSVMTQVGVNMGPDVSPLLESIGADWQERSFNFDDVLHWTKENIDWRTKTFRPAAAPVSAPKTPPGKNASAGHRASSAPHAHPPPSSSAGRSNASFRMGSKVLVYRSNGDWSPAEVSEVKSDRVTVTYTREDKGSTKEIHSTLVDKFLKSA